MLRVTIKQIAQELGISHSTVSRVLNDKQSHLVSDTTRERIIEQATRLGYRPNRLAQALQGNQTNLIGVFVPDEEDYFFQRVIKSLRHTVEASDYELIVFTSSPTQIVSKWHRLLEWDLDGVFAFDYMFYVEGLHQALTHHTGYIPPVVGLFSQHTQLQDYVTHDFRPALWELLEHLEGEGCRLFGYMGPPSSLHEGEQRYAVFSEFVRARGLEQCDLGLSRAVNLMEAGRLCVRAHLQSGASVMDALFCQNDEIALGAYRGLWECGLVVGRDVLVAGCDDIPYISYLEVPLTSLWLPVEEVCREGWRVMQVRMASPESAPSRVVLEAELRLRASCQRDKKTFAEATAIPLPSSVRSFT
jgi:LacI family transcriptional regulator